MCPLSPRASRPRVARRFGLASPAEGIYADRSVGIVPEFLREETGQTESARLNLI